MNAEQARKLAIEAARAADRAEAHAWSLRMEGFGGPAQPSPTIAQCLNGGYGWLEVKCRAIDLIYHFLTPSHVGETVHRAHCEQSVLQ